MASKSTVSTGSNATSKVPAITSSKSKLRTTNEGTALSKNYEEQILKYLRNPASSGIWYMSASWNLNSDLTDEIINQIKQNPDSKRVFKFTAKSNESWESEASDWVSSRISFLFRLFTVMIHSNEDDLETNWRQPGFERSIFRLLDFDKLRNEFAKPLEYFKKHIHFDTFSPSLQLNTVQLLQSGMVILLKGPRDGGEVVFASTHREPLDTLKVFLDDIDKISDCSVHLVFSPEETVFAPYFAMLRATYQTVANDTTALRLFRRAVEEYSDKQYAYCVTSIGMIAEDYLTQVYETFFREAIPKGKTLGQQVDLINFTLGKLFKNDKPTAPNPNTIYDTIRKKIQQSSSDTPNQNSVDILKLIRGLTNFVCDDRKYFFHCLDEINNIRNDISVFPKYLQDDITDLIRYRNAASHKSRIPIGEYEALRAMHSCVRLLMWWAEEKKAIDWNDAPDEIIIKSKERNENIGRKLSD